MFLSVRRHASNIYGFYSTIIVFHVFFVVYCGVLCLACILFLSHYRTWLKSVFLLITLSVFLVRSLGIRILYEYYVMREVFKLFGVVVWVLLSQLILFFLCVSVLC